MINSFRQYLVEETKVVYFTFGRMNPPTIGHGKLLDVLASKSGRNPYKVYLSQTQDAKKNPLTFQQKVKHVRKMFPKHARQIVSNNKVKTAIDALVDLYNQGFTKVVMVVGSDRIREFDVLANKYNGQKARHGFYNFQKIDVISAGERDPDAEGVEGMSASKQRDNAAKNDFISFSQGVPRGMSDANTKRLFNDVRSGMNLKESTFKNHIQLETVSKERELYIHGVLFLEGDYCIVKESSELATIKVLGSNYVIIEAQDGKTYRKWLTDVEPLDLPEEYEAEWGTDKATNLWKKATPGQNESLWANIHAKRRRGEKMRKKGEKGAPTPDQIKRAQGEATTPQDRDIADRKGTQPARYYTGLAKPTKAARDAQFKRQAKMSDKDPAAYKPAPGDKDTETKPSKYTKAFRSMFGEETKLGGEEYRYLHHCPGAITAFKKDIKMHGNTPEIQKAIQAVDHYLEVEDRAKKRGYATQADIDLMKKRQVPAKAAINAAGLKDHDYHQSHIDLLKDMLGKETNEQMTQTDLQKRQDREAQRLAVKHDRQDDILRLKKARIKNRETDPRVKPDSVYKRK